MLTRMAGRARRRVGFLRAGRADLPVVGSIAAALGAIVAYQLIQVLSRRGPWIFPDETRYAEFARAVAESGKSVVASERPIAGWLQSFVLAPAWLFDDPGTAFATAKVINVIAFTLTAVPVFFLARRFVDRRFAAICAAATLLLPATFYAGTLMQEAIALPIATTTVLLTVRLLERFTWPRVAWLILACLAAIGARGQLVVLPILIGVAILVDAGATFANRRRPDWRSVAVAGILGGVGAWAFGNLHGLAILRGGLAGARDDPSRFVEVVAHSTAAMIVGLAVVPAIALFAIVRCIGSENRGRAVFGATALAALIVFIAYTGLKSASQDFAFITLVEERNLIYLQPLAFVAVAAVAGVIRWRTRAIAALLVAGLLVALPILDVGRAAVLSENPGLSWVWHLRQHWTLSSDLPLTLLLVGLAIAGVVLLGRLNTAQAALVGGAILTAAAGWFTYRGDHEFARNLERAWLHPDREWVDRAGGDQDAVMLFDESLHDLNPVYLLVFWNRSIRTYIPVDGGFGPGIAGVPKFGNVDGTFPTDGARHVLVPRSMNVTGDVKATSQDYRLFEVPSGPLGQVSSLVDGVSPDAWVQDELTVKRFVPGPPGTLRLTVSTRNPFLKEPRTVSATVAGKTTMWTVPPGARRTLELPVDPGPLNVVFSLSPAISPMNAEQRRLSLQVLEIQLPAEPPLRWSPG